MKSLFFASAMAALMVLAVPTDADAKTKVKIYFGGMPHYGYQLGPDYRYRNGYGWYQDSGYYDNNRGRLSCGEAKRRVRNNGFRNVATIECQGRTYTFEATRRGRDVTVFVNSRTGALWRG